MPDDRPEGVGREWRPWFAWRPMLVNGYSEGALWRPPRWVWLRRVEYRETLYIDRWLYRLLETATRESGDAG